jgi:hypothetical protein
VALVTPPWALACLIAGREVPPDFYQPDMPFSGLIISLAKVPPNQVRPPDRRRDSIA